MFMAILRTNTKYKLSFHLIFTSSSVLAHCLHYPTLHFWSSRSGNLRYWSVKLANQVMEWNNISTGSSLRPFLATRPENPLAFLYSYNSMDYQRPPPPGLDIRHGLGLEDPQASITQSIEQGNRSRNNNSETIYHNSCGSNIQDKNKRLTCDQLESLERSFLEEIKLDPDRKMRLARDLGLQPRQIAVWFQNRRARWKNKELERLYDALKQEYDVISREKQKLQQEVVKLQAMLMEHHCMKKQVSTTGYNEVSGEETIESAVVVVNRPQPPLSLTESHQMEENNYFQNAEDYIPLPVQPSYWQGSSSHQLPPYP